MGKKSKIMKPKKTKPYVQYLGFLNNKDGEIIDIQISGERFELLPKDEDGQEKDNEEKEIIEPEIELVEDNISFEFYKLITKCVESISAYRPLILLHKQLFGAVYSQIILKEMHKTCLLYTSPSPRDKRQSRMPSSA